MTALPAGYRIVHVWHADDGRSHPYVAHPDGHAGPFDSQAEAERHALEHAGRQIGAPPAPPATGEQQFALF